MSKPVKIDEDEKYLFWGVSTNSPPDDLWEALHKHFESLSGGDDDRGAPIITEEGRAK